MRKYVLMLLTAVTAFFADLCAGELILTGPECPGSVIVVADKASPVAEYAAAELSRHLELVSGVKLPVVLESEAAAPVRIYVGATAAAARAGLGQDKFAKGMDGPLSGRGALSGRRRERSAAFPSPRPRRAPQG